jgi:transposase
MNPKGTTKTAPEIIERALRDYVAGKSIQDIQSYTGRSRPTIVQWASKAGLGGLRTQSESFYVRSIGKQIRAEIEAAKQQENES